LPTFLTETRLTLDRLDAFAGETNDLITQLRPSARQLGPTLTEVADLAPDLERFFDGLVVVNRRARSGFGALRNLLDNELPPPLARVDPYLNELIPIVETLNRYRAETTALFGNVSAATNAANLDTSNTLRGYIRTTNPFSLETLASLPERFTGNRTNAYVKAGNYTKLAQGLDSFLTAQCSSGLSGIKLTEGAPGDLPEGFFDEVKQFAYGDGTNSNGIPAPRCDLQEGSESIGGTSTERTTYPHIRAQP
jgi:ABC-type transporter Mla subunit MlaD